MKLTPPDPKTKNKKSKIIDIKMTFNIPFNATEYAYDFDAEEFKGRTNGDAVDYLANQGDCYTGSTDHYDQVLAFVMEHLQHVFYDHKPEMEIVLRSES